MIRNFENKTAVLTGGGSGFGLECARIAARLKMNVVLVDVQQDALDKAEAEIKALGVKVFAKRVDVSNAEQMEALAKDVVAHFGVPHFVFNNAGVGAGGLVWENSVQDWEWLLGVNLWGVIHGALAFVPRMLAQPGEQVDRPGLVLVARRAQEPVLPRLGNRGIRHHEVGIPEVLLDMTSEPQRHRAIAHGGVEKRERLRQSARLVEVGQQHCGALRQQVPRHTHTSAELPEAHDRHALAAHELGLDTEATQKIVDHRPAAMDNNRVHTHLPHQDDITGKLGHGLGIAHCVAAEFHDDDRAGIALKERQGLGKGPGGGDPVSVHVLFPHLLASQQGQSMVAMIARSVSIPSLFSEEVRTISGKAAGCLASDARVISSDLASSVLLTLSDLVITT